MVTAGVGTAVEWAHQIAAATPDPELPIVTLGDLGILRSVEVLGGRVIATITPTYSGCPALREIAVDLRYRLVAAGFTDVEVRTQLVPPWTTEWITPAGRQALAAAGIAPPLPVPARKGPIPLQLAPTSRRIACPRCGADDTVCTAEFAATACTALYRCRACAEPFEYVKER